MLRYEVFIAPEKPIATDDLPPGHTRRMFSPISATLIYGERDALLVDPLMTLDETRALADWVASKGKTLKTIYVTHGHGDHSFGIGAIRQRFPEARAVATRGVIGHMKKQLAPEFMSAFWKARFPDQLPEEIPFPEALDGNVIELEGEQLVAVDLGHTDTDDTTCLHVPSLGLVVAGDAAYNDVHQYLSESDAGGRRAWLAAIDRIEALQPVLVVAGHKRPGTGDGPHILEETRRYILDFDRAAAETKTARQLYDAMLALYPQRVNPGALWSSARATKG